MALRGKTARKIIDGLREANAHARGEKTGAVVTRVRKYRNKPCIIDGIRFDSQKEGRHYILLKLRQAAGEIRSLVVHPRFSIEVKDEHVCNYVADFIYYEHEPHPKRETWRRRVVDVKGGAVRTREYLLKKKLMRIVHGIEIEEV